MLNEYATPETRGFTPNATVSVSGPLPPELLSSAPPVTGGDLMITEDGEYIPVPGAISYDEAAEEFDEEYDGEAEPEPDGNFDDGACRLFLDALFSSLSDPEYFVGDAEYSTDGGRTALRFPDADGELGGFTEISFDNDAPTTVSLAHTGKDRFFFVLEKDQRHTVVLSDLTPVVAFCRCTKLENRLGKDGGSLSLEFTVESYMPSTTVKVTYKVSPLLSLN